MRTVGSQSTLVKGVCHTEWHQADLQGHCHHDVKVRVYSQDTVRLWDDGCARKFLITWYKHRHIQE